MNLFNSYDDSSDLFNNPIILNMMNNMNSSPKDAPPPKDTPPRDTPPKNSFSPNMPNLFNAFLTPEQKSQYDNYMKELSNLQI